MVKITIAVVFLLLHSGYCKKRLFPASSSFIAASYVKAVESSGGRVVPVAINKPESYYRNILSHVNGLVLPGGATLPGNGNPYYDSVKTVYKIAKELNDNGTVFPILAVCLGFEFLLIVANNDTNFLKSCNVMHENHPITFKLPYLQSTLFKHLTIRQAHTLQYLNSTVNFHRWCAFENDFVNSSLNEKWIITSTSTSADNVKFIATVEHVKYPFFGTQFHPEKVSFEWDPNHFIPHSERVILANRYFYDRLLHFAKKNSNSFPSTTEENNSMIYNYFPRYTASMTSYLQMYLF